MLWKLKLHNAKSIHVNFTTKRIQNNILHIGNIEIPYYNKAKYLGMTLDAKLHWKEHVKMKKQEFDPQFSKLY